MPKRSAAFVQEARQTVATNAENHPSNAILSYPWFRFDDLRDSVGSSLRRVMYGASAISKRPSSKLARTVIVRLAEAVLVHLEGNQAAFLFQGVEKCQIAGAADCR